MGFPECAFTATMVQSGVPMMSISRADFSTGVDIFGLGASTRAKASARLPSGDREQEISTGMS